jgi:hypothetical protein
MTIMLMGCLSLYAKALTHSQMTPKKFSEFLIESLQIGFQNTMSAFIAELTLRINNNKI